MSNHLAIATVTATIGRLLQNAAVADLTNVANINVTTVRPDMGTPAVGINVFLYQVTPNVAFRNADLPTRRADGSLMQRPTVALDLHYLLTFYGDEGKLEPQRLLGSASKTLHAQPNLTQQAILDTLADPKYNYLAASDLADQIELVRLTPLPLSLEELSKLWSVFFQTHYTLSMAYQGAVVLIETDEVAKVSLPVRARNVYAVTFAQPIIEKVSAATGEGQPITGNSSLVITGQNLRGDITRVLVSGLDVEPVEKSSRRISLPIPVAARKAGVQTVQVVHPRALGTPPALHRGVESNVYPFVLQPLIAVAATPVSSRVVDGVTLHTADVKVTFSPRVGKKQRVSLLLNEFQTVPTTAARAYVFPFAARDKKTDPVDTDNLTVRVTDVVPGSYLVRVQVDGAESPLHQNVSGRYDAPRVNL